MNSHELIDKYPQLCSEARKYGSGVGDGWVSILDELFTELEALGLEDLRIHQFKQKLGYLMVYPDPNHFNHAEVNRLIELAGEKARVTCEYCGKPGKITSGFCIRIICEKCKKK